MHKKTTELEYKDVFMMRFCTITWVLMGDN